MSGLPPVRGSAPVPGPAPPAVRTCWGPPRRGPATTGRERPGRARDAGRTAGQRPRCGAAAPSCSAGLPQPQPQPPPPRKWQPWQPTRSRAAAPSGVEPTGWPPPATQHGPRIRPWSGPTDGPGPAGGPGTAARPAAVPAAAALGRPCRLRHPVPGNRPTAGHPVTPARQEAAGHRSSAAHGPGPRPARRRASVDRAARGPARPRRRAASSRSAGPGQSQPRPDPDVSSAAVTSGAAPLPCVPDAVTPEAARCLAMASVPAGQEVPREELERLGEAGHRGGDTRRS